MFVSSKYCSFGFCPDQLLVLRKLDVHAGQMLNLLQSVEAHCEDRPAPCLCLELVHNLIHIVLPVVLLLKLHSKTKCKP